MKLLLRLLLLSLTFILNSACSDNEQSNPLLGTWKLASWEIDIPFELEDEGGYSLNFLNFTQCPINETLSFNKNGVVTSNDSFNPEVTIRLKDESSDNYLIEEVCSEGSIGFSTSFEQPELQKVSFNNAKGYVENKQLTLIYEEAVKIYNESRTEVLEEKNLTLTYILK